MQRIARLACLAMFFTIGSLATSLARAADAPPFEFRDGDFVVTLGPTFIEREGQFGQLETMLTAAQPDKNIRFRNLGWSADTVWAESRGIFDPPAEGYRRLIAMVQELQPTVVVLAYGLDESYTGAAGIEPFVKQYEQLCHDVGGEGRRIVLVTPMPLEKGPAPLPDASAQNPMLANYVAAVQELGKRREYPVIDLFHRSRTSTEPLTTEPLTMNGMHLNNAGYERLANELAAQWKLAHPQLDDDAYAVLRQAIVEKNQLYFHRWRPQNTTYLLGFRKHEQGNNAVEIPQFDELVSKAEANIQQLKRGPMKAAGTAPRRR